MYHAAVVEYIVECTSKEAVPICSNTDHSSTYLTVGASGPAKTNINVPRSDHSLDVSFNYLFFYS